MDQDFFDIIHSAKPGWDPGLVIRFFWGSADLKVHWHETVIDIVFNFEFFSLASLFWLLNGVSAKENFEIWTEDIGFKDIGLSMRGTPSKTY